MGGFASVTNLCDGDLSIGGVALRGPAWWVLDLLDLWEDGDQSGDDVPIPGLDGDLAQARFREATRHLLPMAINGEVDENDVPYANVWAGLRANFATLNSSLVAPPGTTDGTRSAVLTLPDGTQLTEPVHVTRLQRGKVQAGTNALTGESGVVLLATLELSIPSGRFA